MQVLARSFKIPPLTLAVVVAVGLAGCQPGSNPRPVPSVQQIGGDLKCAAGDHGYEDFQGAWGFCYPEAWKFTQRAQSYSTPPELDVTFNITYVPATPQPCPTAEQVAVSASPCEGAFAYMIVSTYSRGDASDLAGWARSNLPKTETVAGTISWGNAVEAARLSDGRRIALTPHQVVILDLHSGLLDLEGEMSSRLDTWRFSY